MSRIKSSGQLNASDINVELRRAWNAPFSLYDGQTRQLAAYQGGELRWSHFYGKQLYYEYGTPMGRYCANQNLFEIYADGNGGTFSNVIEWNSPGCGYIPPPPPPTNNNPPYGTVLQQFCTGTSLMTIFADGNGGTQSQESPNHPSCVGGGFEGG